MVVYASQASPVSLANLFDGRGLDAMLQKDARRRVEDLGLAVTGGLFSGGC